jgi:hypothetical protein
MGPRPKDKKTLQKPNQGDVHLLLNAKCRILQCWPRLGTFRRGTDNADYFFWKSSDSLIYTGINVSLVEAFLAHNKVKANDNTSSHIHIHLHKYKDASILWCSQQAKQLLPRGYYEEVSKFLQCFWKESVDAKKEGKLDEQEAEPIRLSLFKLILSWALDTSNIFFWTNLILPMELHGKIHQYWLTGSS